jgi:hypothetical protein
VQTYLAQPLADKDFNADAVDVWIRLCMFHQLWLAYGDNFFQQLHRQTREEKPDFNHEDAAAMQYFMRKACQISGKDLTGFFKKWGLKNDSAYAAIRALNLPAPVQDPSVLTD